MSVILPFLKRSAGLRLYVYGVIILLLAIAPFVLSDFRLSLLGRFLSFAILAMALDLLWGYTGVLSLGHGVFFSLGAYVMAMHIKLQSQPLPDFMEWSGLTALPAFLVPLKYFWVALPLTVLVPVFLAILIGAPTFRAGIRGVYFSILTQALALVFWIFFVGQQGYTGGTNGITDLNTVQGFSLSASSVKHGLYWLTLGVLLLVFVLAWILVQSRAGRVMIAVRDHEERLKYLGYSPNQLKLAVFVLSAAIAGLAGALYVPQVGIISPAMMEIQRSVEIVVWVAMGGRGTLVGAVLGALGVNLSGTYFSEAFPAMWLFFIGGVFILVVVVFPKGLLGLLEQAAELFKKTITNRKKVKKS